MKRFLCVLGFLALGPIALSAGSDNNCGRGCCKANAACCGQMMAALEPAATGKAPDSAKPDASAKRHPLRGVIVAVHADTSELRVKHEAIPGVMRAMTMMFKVEPGTLKSVQAGQTITAQMSREDGAWWLHDVKVVASAR